MMINKLIAIGSDHAGYNLKKELIKYLVNQDYYVLDEGTYDTSSVDYPDYAKKVSLDIINNQVNYGILVCYTGIGMAITCNKFHGIRGALVDKIDNVILTRQHNNANIICLGAKDLEPDFAIQLVNTFLTTPFLGERHLRRINKIKAIEDEIK